MMMDRPTGQDNVQMDLHKPSNTLPDQKLIGPATTLYFLVFKCSSIIGVNSDTHSDGQFGLIKMHQSWSMFNPHHIPIQS